MAKSLFLNYLLLGPLMLVLQLQVRGTDAWSLRPFFRRQRQQHAVKTVGVANQFQDLLLSRRTINDFEPNLPDHWNQSLHTAIQAATYAPNHKRTEPWRFHLLGPASVRRVCELNAQLVSAQKGIAAGEKKLNRWLAMPGWLVVTCRRTTTNNRSDDIDNNNVGMNDPMSVAREDYAACCCAVQNLCLSLHANGIGTKWTTGPVNFDEGFSEAVGFSADEEYVVGTIWFGTPVSSSIPQAAPPKKLTMNEIFIQHD